MFGNDMHVFLHEICSVFVNHASLTISLSHVAVVVVVVVLFFSPVVVVDVVVCCLLVFIIYQGSCANAPMVQLNDDYYECLTPVYTHTHNIPSHIL